MFVFRPRWPFKMLTLTRSSRVLLVLLQRFPSRTGNYLCLLHVLLSRDMIDMNVLQKTPFLPDRT